MPVLRPGAAGTRATIGTSSACCASGKATSLLVAHAPVRRRLRRAGAGGLLGLPELAPADRTARSGGTRPAIAFEQPEPSGAKPHPLARHIEITGFRLSEDARQRATIQFLVVNHSGADISGLEAEVQLTAVSPKGERQPVGRFSFKAPRLGPYESREFKAPLETALRVYELPDWQFLRAEFRIISPAP